MADRRKLQGEIDRCLKKVAEGVETFEDIWQKVHNATNANQKEKYEADLKKEIKKLQRLRDQIKTWCASSEIKDKRQLVDNRKLIETQMERFKVVERETKTKAYSKEGLGAVQKLDPVQKERDEITNWLSASIDTLSVQVDQFESEIEALQVVQKKSKKDRDKHERNDFLKNRVEKHRYHIKQLETLMRMLDNETVEVDDIKKIKDDIEYYIESSQDAEFQDNEYIYDDLDLEDMKAFRANNVVDSNLALAKSSSTTSASKDANTSSNTASVDNEDIPNAQSNPSSANESPAPSPGLPNTHSTNSTGKAINTPVPQEFSFISSSPSTTTTTTNTLSTTPPATNKPVWTSSSVVTSKAPPPSSTPSSSVASTPYAAAVASLASASAKVVMSNELANDPRLQANSGTLSFADSSVNHHSIAPPTSAVVTLYAAAAAAASSVTATAPVSTNAWSSTASGPNPAEVPTNHQLLNARQLSNASQIPLTPQQQQMMMQQQQQQQNNHLMNGFKVENQSIANLKTLAQQTVTSSGLDEQMDNSLIMSNLTNMTTSNGSNANSINPINLLNDLSNSGSNATLNSTMPMDPSSMFKNNLLVHQRNSQLMQAANSPAASASPPSNLMGTPSVPSNVNSGGNISSSDNMASSNAVGVGTLTNLINAAPGAPVNPNPTQVFFQAYSNQVNKSALPKQFYIHMHLLDSAYRHPIIPLDSHRLKPLTKMIPSIQTAFSGSHLPNQILPQFDNLEFYKRLTPETLFFIFYYMEGTRAQYLAAKTLKIKSWRFHTKFMMWFQRLEEPKVITDDYEQGTYIFFDFNKWSQQKKEGFVFEYKYLEDKELN